MGFVFGEVWFGLACFGFGEVFRLGLVWAALRDIYGGGCGGGERWLGLARLGWVWFGLA